MSFSALFCSSHCQLDSITRSPAVDSAAPRNSYSPTSRCLLFRWLLAFLRRSFLPRRSSGHQPKFISRVQCIGCASGERSSPQLSAPSFLDRSSIGCRWPASTRSDCMWFVVDGLWFVVVYASVQNCFLLSRFPYKSRHSALGSRNKTLPVKLFLVESRDWKSTIVLFVRWRLLQLQCWLYCHTCIPEWMHQHLTKLPCKLNVPMTTHYIFR